ncbi:MAG: hypothetical protein AB8G05_19965 [Oligoflexales bacterium]
MHLHDKEKLAAALNNVLKSIGCVSHIFGLVYLKNQIDNFDNHLIIKIIENTEERFEDYIEVEKNSSGRINGSRSKRFSDCRFEVNHPNKEEYLKKWKNFK